MAEPSLDLQKAVIATLKADASVTALVGQRIYDQVPPNATFPYVSWGPDQVLADKADCQNGFEVFAQIDVWSRAPGKPEAKRIAGAVRAALDDAELTLDDHALLLLEHVQTRHLIDPDGSTKHSIVELRALADGA